MSVSGLKAAFVLAARHVAEVPNAAISLQIFWYPRDTSCCRYL
jgi:hypothetical protein